MPSIAQWVYWIERDAIWVAYYDPSKTDEFSSMLSDLEGIDRGAYDEETKSWPYYDKSKEMRGFLQENLIPLAEPLEPRRIEDKLMDSFIQRDNKYNMGE